MSREGGARIFDHLDGADPDEVRILVGAARAMRDSWWWAAVVIYEEPPPVSGEIEAAP